MSNISLQKILRRAQSISATIVLPESLDLRVLEAAEQILQKKIAKIILLGNPREIETVSQANNLNLKTVEIINPQNYKNLRKMEQILLEKRKHKNITIKECRKLLKDPLYFGVMLVETGIAEGMVAGAKNSSASVLRPALQIIKSRNNLVSSFFLMFINDLPYIFSDCGLNVNPTASELADIAISSATSAKMLSITPRVALLSHSTKGSAINLDSKKIQLAAQILGQKNPSFVFDGEMQLDAAIVPKIAKIKCPSSPLRGNANVLIFPDLNSGNIGYKLVERFASAKAVGPVLQGLKKPINDLSRGCRVNDIVMSVAITCLQAKEQNTISD